MNDVLAAAASRRAFLMGAGALASAPFVSAWPFHLLGRARVALAAGEAAATQPTLVQIVLIDKVQAALFQKIDGTPPPGADSQNGIAQKEAAFRQMGLTALFGDALAALPDTVALSLNNTWQSGNVGHSLAGARVGAYGSVNGAFETLTRGSGILGPIGFSVRSDANDSADAFQDGTNRPMQTFRDVGQLLNTVQGSVTSLTAARKNRTLVERLDGLVTSDKAARKSLDALLDKVDQVIPALTAAQGVQDQLDAQVQAVVALSKAGLARNFMIAVPWDDTNGGGNLTSTGGAFAIDPFSATPKIAKALVDLHAGIPELVCVSTSDGGRSANNADRSAGFAFLTGPSRAVKNGVVGGRFQRIDQVGNTFGDATLSDGTKRPSTPSDWYATALRAMGLAPDAAHVAEALV